MEVVEQQAAWLSDYEVLEHLREQKSQRDLVSKNLGRPVQAAENVQTLEFEVLHYGGTCSFIHLGTRVFGKALRLANG